MAYQAPEIQEVGAVAELTEWGLMDWFKDCDPKGSVTYRGSYNGS